MLEVAQPDVSNVLDHLPHAHAVQVRYIMVKFHESPVHMIGPNLCSETTRAPIQYKDDILPV